MRLTNRTREDVSSRCSELWRINWKREGYPYCGIYVISPDNRWPSKIGISQNPAKRVIELQVACWRKLDIAEYCFAADMAAARLVEQKSHEILIESDRLMQGEWFDMRPDKAMDVIKFAALKVGVELRTDHELMSSDAMIRCVLKDMGRSKWADRIST